MKRYICKKNENRDCYTEAVIEILDKMKDLENDSLILKSIDLCENTLVLVKKSVGSNFLLEHKHLF